MNRRGFFGALVALATAPKAVKFLPIGTSFAGLDRSIKIGLPNIFRHSLGDVVRIGPGRYVVTGIQYDRGDMSIRPHATRFSLT